MSCFWPYLEIIVTKNVTISAQKIKNLFHKSNWNQTKESNVCRRLVVFDVSLHTKFQNIAQEKTENVHVFACQAVCQKNRFISKNMICDFVLKKCHFQSGLVRDHHNGTLFVFFTSVVFIRCFRKNTTYLDLFICVIDVI